MPWYLGGTGQLEAGFIDIPFVKVDETVLIYGLINFGFRVESLITHIFFTERGSDFEEMLLHDIVTFFLCFGYISSNFLPVGTMILILHDCSDFPFHLCKGINASIYKSYASYIFVTAQLIWGYFRLYCLPRIIQVLLDLKYPAHRAQFDPFITIAIVFLSTLLVLHIIWFLMFQRINAQHFLAGKKVKDDDMVIHGADDEEEDKLKEDFNEDISSPATSAESSPES